MTALRQRNEPVRLMWKRLGLLALLGLVILVGSGVWSAYEKDNESATLNQQSQAALADLTAQDSQLQGNIASLQSDRGKEAALRDQYAVGKQGEDMIVIVDSSSTPPPPPPSFLDQLKKVFSWW